MELHTLTAEPYQADGQFRIRFSDGSEGPYAYQGQPVVLKAAIARLAACWNYYADVAVLPEPARWEAEDRWFYLSRCATPEVERQIHRPIAARANVYLRSAGLFNLVASDLYGDIGPLIWVGRPVSNASRDDDVKARDRAIASRAAACWNAVLGRTLEELAPPAPRRTPRP